MDVETNGSIAQRGTTPTKDRLHMFPNIVQCSWGLYAETGECKVLADYDIKLDGWPMHCKGNFHGIAFEKALNECIDLNNVSIEYANDIEHCCSKPVCHNMILIRCCAKRVYEKCYGSKSCW